MDLAAATRRALGPRGRRWQERLTLVAAGFPGLGGEEEYFRERQRIGMCDGEERRRSAQRAESSCGATMKPKLRRPAVPDHLDAAPQDLRRMTGSEGFQRRFLGCETTGKMNRRLASPRTVGDLRLREDAIYEAVAESRNGRRDARNIGRVESQANDGRH